MAGGKTMGGGFYFWRKKGEGGGEFNGYRAVILFPYIYSSNTGAARARKGKQIGFNVAKRFPLSFQLTSLNYRDYPSLKKRYTEKFHFD